MQAQISFGMFARVSGYLREPGAWHHDAARIDQPARESFDRSGINGMGCAEIVGVDDQEFGIARVTEAFD